MRTRRGAALLAKGSSKLEFATNLQVDAGVIVVGDEGQLGVARAKTVASLAADAVVHFTSVRDFDHGADLGVGTTTFDTDVEIYVHTTDTSVEVAADIGFRVEVDGGCVRRRCQRNC